MEIKAKRIRVKPTVHQRVIKHLLHREGIHRTPDYQLYRIAKLAEAGNTNARAFLKTLPISEREKAEKINKEIREARQHDIKFKNNQEAWCEDVYIDGVKTGYIRTKKFEPYENRNIPLEWQRQLKKIDHYYKECDTVINIKDMYPFSKKSNLRGKGVGIKVLEKIEEKEYDPERAGGTIFLLETDDLRHSRSLIERGYQRLGDHTFIKRVKGRIL